MVCFVQDDVGCQSPEVLLCDGLISNVGHLKWVQAQHEEQFLYFQMISECL